MNRRPQSSYGDAPPGYDQETASFLSDVESPTNASRLNGGTMRLLPTSGDGADDFNTSPSAASPSHYNYDPDYDNTPYVLLPLSMPPHPSSHSSRFPRDRATFTTNPKSLLDMTGLESLCLVQLDVNGHCIQTQTLPPR
jgi:hypothetical protein